jgi:formate hydrogenlyase transcriptional activator
LQNLIERSVILSPGRVLRSLTHELNRPSQLPASRRTLMDAERAHIVAALDDTQWRVGGRIGAATRLGLPRTTLIAKMQKLGISRASGEPAKLQVVDAEKCAFAASSAAA